LAQKKYLQKLIMNDFDIRLYAFDWLKRQIEIKGDVLPRDLLQKGFNLSGVRYGLVGPKGIWKPGALLFPISITSILNSPYHDSIDKDSGILRYRYRGTNPNHSDNAYLREMMKQRIPLIYFHNIAENKYLPMWPVYVVGDNLANLTFTIMADDIAYLSKKSIKDNEAADSRRLYITATTLMRVHQKSFRERVLRAYKNQCSLCRLKHTELLDAAHIIGDREDNGEPVIQNGLSLCKIHHAAFDNYIIGITSDFQVKVRKDILEEIDGPMLKFGLQSLNNNKIILPNNKNEWPDRERLELRYDKFIHA
jgi:putative restriction endonuclease